MKQFHERVRERMEALGLSQTDLAKIIGIKQSSVWSLLQGDIAKPRFIIELAKALKTTPQWLLTGRLDGASPAEALQDSSSSRALLSELASAAIDSLKTPKMNEDLAKITQDMISEYFWADVEKGKPPTYDQVMRLARTLIGKK